MESRKEQLFWLHAFLTIQLQYVRGILTVTTSQLVPSALSTAQMLEVLNGCCPGSYTPKHMIMKFHSLFKLIFSSFFLWTATRESFLSSCVGFFPRRHHTTLSKWLYIVIRLLNSSSVADAVSNIFWWDVGKAHTCREQLLFAGKC